MNILGCRVAWMPYYQSDDEPAVGGGGYVDRGEIPHESLNFLSIDGIYYGFVENSEENLNLERLGGQKTDDKIDGVSVVFCAVDKKSNEFLVTGWYSRATVYRSPIKIDRPGDSLKRHIYFTTKNATLIDESERCFSIPRARKNRRGGFGQRQIWYGLNDDDEQMTEIRTELLDYMARQSSQRTPEETIVESRKRRISERIEREGTDRKRFIEKKGYRCEACEWTITENEKNVWSSSFELHHLTPFSELEEGTSRRVGINDFAVLCASCHRGIHRTEYVSDVKSFAKHHIL